MVPLAHPHSLDPQRLAGSIWEAHNRLANELVQQLASLMAQTDVMTEQWGAEDQTRTEVATPVQHEGAACAASGAINLEHFYTSKQNGRTLCVAYFEQPVEQGTVRKTASAGS